MNANGFCDCDTHICRAKMFTTQETIYTQKTHSRFNKMKWKIAETSVYCIKALRLDFPHCVHTENVYFS